jgi:hypothetical protein
MSYRTQSLFAAGLLALIAIGTTEPPPATTNLMMVCRDGSTVLAAGTSASACPADAVDAAKKIAWR